MAIDLILFYVHVNWTPKPHCGKLSKTKWGGNAIALPPDCDGENEISFTQICV